MEGRVYRKLRISVTDRCQFRCFYCMPDGPEANWLPREQMLSFEEIALAAEWLALRGLREIRITGGEPLLRRGLPNLIALLKAVPGVERVSLTTNGLRLAEQFDELAAAGLDAINVSLDTLRSDRLERFAGVPDSLDRVLAGINRLSGSTTISGKKLNTVVVRGGNDDEIPEIVAFASALGLEARFIEFMPFGSRWGDELVVGVSEIVGRIEAAYGRVEALTVRPGSTSMRWRVPGLGARATFGVIPTMSGTLCSECDRLRLSADGRVHRCLFDSQGFDVSAAIRAGDGAAFIADVERYLAGKGPGFLAVQRNDIVPLRHMHSVGG